MCQPHLKPQLTHSFQPVYKLHWGLSFIDSVKSTTGARWVTKLFLSQTRLSVSFVGTLTANIFLWASPVSVMAFNHHMKQPNEGICCLIEEKKAWEWLVTGQLSKVSRLTSSGLRTGPVILKPKNPALHGGGGTWLSQFPFLWWTSHATALQACKGRNRMGDSPLRPEKAF